MSYAIKIGTTEAIWIDTNPTPDGYVRYDNSLPLDPIWDGSIDNGDGTFGNIREKNAVEKKTDAASKKREEIYREQEIRSATVWGKEVDRHMFAWIEEFYTAILKVSARNNITEAGAPITFGLKQLRDNRDTLLNGLDTWVNDPLKSADDIAAFDVVGWAGWTVARP